MITSTQNQLVKLFRKLHASKYRSEFELSLLEGSHLLEEALISGGAIDTLCYTEDWSDRYPALYEQSLQQSDRVELVSESVLTAMATTVKPDGVVATIARRSHVDFELQSFGLALSRIQDPGNVGTMIRTAAAAGVDGLWLSRDSVELDHPKVMRASAGQWFRLPMATVTDLDENIRQAKRSGMQIVTTMPKADRTYWDVDFTQPTLVVMGNEGAGLSPEMAALADVPVAIPLARGVESLNVAIAAAIILYEVQRQRCGYDSRAENPRESLGPR
jgi:RNA methyltransferase, TrmH family